LIIYFLIGGSVGGFGKFAFGAQIAQKFYSIA
jgi:hypothetical protein